MKLKKLFLIIFSLCLTLALACGLAACGGDNEDAGVPVASVGLNKTSLEIEVDEAYKITATVLPSNATDLAVVWSSSNTSVATVVDGLVTGKAAGNATITAKAGKRQATCAVTVKEKSAATVPVTSVTLNKSSHTLAVGATYTLVSTVLPANATDREVTWTSSDSHYVTVSSKGVIEGKAVGSATITATAGGKSATCSVTVESNIVPVTAVTLSASSMALKVGESQTLTAQITPADATDKAVKWSTSNDKVATVSNGKVVAVAAGTAKITATADGKSATCDVTVKNADPVKIPVTGVTLNKDSLELAIGGDFTLIATVAPADATDKAVSWSTSNDKIATVSNGKVVAVAAGTAKITATADGKSATCDVTVKNAPATTVPVANVTLNRNSLELEIGEDFTLTATVTPANATDKTVSWSTLNDKVATVSNGKVVAVAAGTAKITATAGGVSATCDVTVKNDAPVKIPVTGVTMNKDSLELKVDETSLLTVTIAPLNATDTEVVWRSGDNSVASVEDGLVTAKAVGETKIYATVDGVTAECEIGVIAKEEPEQPITDSIITYAHAGEETAAFEWSDANASGAKVEYKLSTSGSYTRVDSQLIRQISSDTARVDVLGLKGGAKYDFKITSGDNKTATVKEVLISSLDRTGYAHFNYTSGVGAYNDDGTLKSNAKVIYLTEENKNDIDGKGTSIAEYLSSSAKNEQNAIVIRVIGTVGSATWNTLEYNKAGHEGDDITVDKVVGANGKKLPTDSSKLTQTELVKGGYNTLNEYPSKLGGAKCVAIDGLESKAIYKVASGDKAAEYDSCWNDCQVKEVNNITIEGIGEDAEIFQFGFTFKSCNSVEVRNLRFYDYTEDACSFEGSENSTTLDGFKHSNFWLHHNTFDVGVNYWDICREQDKHDGDGSTDFKYLKNVTIAYNHYIKTHKTGLVGGDDKHHQANFTFHHNYYENCDQRMPLGRQANMHMYNNYYSGSGLYSISLRAGAYAFVENCVFTYGKSSTKPIEMKSGSNGSPSCKVIDCDLGTRSVTNEVSSDNLYVDSDREKTVKGDNLYGMNFELATGFYTVTNKLATSEVKTVIPEVAGVQKRKSNIKIDGANEEEKPPVVTPPAGEDTNKVTMNVADAVSAGKLTVDNTNKQDYTNEVLADGITLTLKQGKVTEHSNEIGGKSFTHRIVIGKVSSSNTRYFKIDAEAACTIKVYVANLGDAAREIGLYTDTEGKNRVTGTNTESIAAGGKDLIGFSVTAAGTYYLESITGDLSIYQIEIIYSE